MAQRMVMSIGRKGDGLFPRESRADAKGKIIASCADEKLVRCSEDSPNHHAAGRTSKEMPCKM